MKSEHFKYMWPIFGLISIWNDIPHYEHEYKYKPLQGDDVFGVIFWSMCSTASFIFLVIKLLV